MSKYYFSVWIMVLAIGLAAVTDVKAGDVQTASSTAKKKSLREWASCDGVADDTANLKRALAAAKNSAFTLVVDCPARLAIGMDITHSIFIDNGTTVEFAGSGKFTIDNVMIPAFVIANTHDVVLTDWNVEYDAGLPIDGNVGGYLQDNEFFAARGSVQPAGAFSEFVLTRWLQTNRGVTFQSTYSLWRGGVTPIATILMSGDTSNVTVSGMHMYVPPDAGGNRFIPVAFSFWPNFKSNQTVYASTPIVSKYVGVPHDITFSNVVLDGTYFGWLGNAQHVLFENITSHRYGDLQDAAGGNVGGVGKWFPPPHLFYLTYAVGEDASLLNTNLQLKNIMDEGPRIGTARDKGGSDTSSGYALSLKIACIDCVVDNYASSRPDGFLDVLASTNLVISNATSTYDSSFLHNLYPSFRFPTHGYKDVTFENISLTDRAVSSVRAPMGDATSTTNENLVFSNVFQQVNHWASAGFVLPNIVGASNAAVTYAVADNGTEGSGLYVGESRVILQATPTTVKRGESIKLTWKAEDATSCSAVGAWSGALSSEGWRGIKMSGSAGSRLYTLRCQDGHGAFSTSVTVTVE